jgi:hypothetical protein
MMGFTRNPAVRFYDRSDLDPAVAAHGTARDGYAGEPEQEHGRRFRLDRFGWWRVKQLAATMQGVAPRAIGEQAEVANAHEAPRHDVQEKASQEFVGLEAHHLHAIVIGVVLPPETDLALSVVHQPIIR